LLGQVKGPMEPRERRRGLDREKGPNGLEKRKRGTNKKHQGGRPSIKHFKGVGGGEKIRKAKPGESRGIGSARGGWVQQRKKEKKKWGGLRKRERNPGP